MTHFGKWWNYGHLLYFRRWYTTRRTLWTINPGFFSAVQICFLGISLAFTAATTSTRINPGLTCARHCVGWFTYNFANPQSDSAFYRCRIWDVKSPACGNPVSKEQHPDEPWPGWLQDLCLITVPHWHSCFQYWGCLWLPSCLLMYHFILEC